MLDPMTDQLKISNTEHMSERTRTGRPTKYQVRYCSIVVELGKTGFSLVQIASHFDVCRQTLDNWAKEHPEFLEALSRAKTHAQAWWEFQAMSGLNQPKFNSRIWEKSVQARFREDYTKSPEVIHPSAFDKDQIMQDFRKNLERLSEDQLLALDDIMETIHSVR